MFLGVLYFFYRAHVTARVQAKFNPGFREASFELTERSRLIDLKYPVSEQLSYTVFSTTITKPTDFTQFFEAN